MRTGELTVYLGAAPGVGTTYAMLDDAHRRAGRGARVLVAHADARGRPRTAEQIDGLERVSPDDLESLTRADVVLVDDLATRTSEGSRADLVTELLGRGVDVIATVDVSDLASLSDEVDRITGRTGRPVVPDEMVRGAARVQLVDMDPEALRRRLAHGNVVAPDEQDASLRSLFRVETLAALRELALLWMADRVEERLMAYRREQGLEATPTRERVVVAVAADAASETLVRRGAHVARRPGSVLHVVHVRSDRTATEPTALQSLHLLTESLGGDFHVVAGEDVARTVVDFGAAMDATVLVVGVSSRGGLGRWRPSTSARVARLAGPLDVHLVGEPAASAAPTWSLALPRRRRTTGWLLAILGPALLTAALVPLRERHGLSTDVLLYLALAVAVALVGGRLPAMASALIGFVCLNWFFTPPTGRLSIAEPANALALVVFLVVAGSVSSVVDSAARRAEEARRARAEAATFSELSRTVLAGGDSAAALVGRLRETFGLAGVELRGRSTGEWLTLAAAGSTEGGATRVPVDDDHELVLHGPDLVGSDRRVVEAFATQARLAMEYARLRDREREATVLEAAEDTRRALLRAVSHDLRTPLATIRAGVDGLVGQAPLSPDDRAELTVAIGDATADLEHLVGNLLDLSRIQTGTLRPHLGPVALEEVLPGAFVGIPAGAVEVDLPEGLPLVRTDAGLLSRVVGNLLSNAVRHSPPGRRPRVTAEVYGDRLDLLVVDRGSGVHPRDRERLFRPFQRLDDTGPEGLGLGLAVALGLARAVDATVTPDDTPGGGLTMTVSVPRA